MGNVTFDFIFPGEKGVFPFLSNLFASEFSMQEIKELYAMRWGIETSFRELKHALSLNKLHSKKTDHIHQEIFAKAIMYNFCSVITIVVENSKREIPYIIFIKPQY